LSVVVGQVEVSVVVVVVVLVAEQRLSRESRAFAVSGLDREKIARGCERAGWGS
jgi:hypothetical protein